MVNQVNDKGWAALGSVLPQGSSASPQAANRSAAGPAVKLELSETSLTSKASTASLDEMASSDLIREIRERVESGRFSIDYAQLSKALLQDVVSQTIRPKD